MMSFLHRGRTRIHCLRAECFLCKGPGDVSAAKAPARKSGDLCSWAPRLHSPAALSFQPKPAPGRQRRLDTEPLKAKSP